MVTSPTFAPGADIEFEGAYDLTNADRAEIIDILGSSHAPGIFTYAQDTEPDSDDYWLIYYKDDNIDKAFYVEYDDEAHWYLDDLPQSAIDTLQEVFEHLIDSGDFTLFPH